MSQRADRTRVYLVCSPLGSVGKTVTARLLLEHAARDNVAAVGFDTNHLDATLSHLYPAITHVVDLSTVRGQMEFFDRLIVGNRAPKVVDLWHATYDLFWSQADKLGFFHEARAQGVDLVVFLQADRRGRFLQELRSLPAHNSTMPIVLVQNHAVMDVPRSDEERIALVSARHLFTIPKFEPTVLSLLEEPGHVAGKLATTLPSTGAMFKTMFDQLTFLDLCFSKAKA